MGGSRGRPGNEAVGVTIADEIKSLIISKPFLSRTTVERILLGLLCMSVLCHIYRMHKRNPAGDTAQ
jgi:hypothetical protein